MKFVTFNIQYGLGSDGRFDLNRVAAAVAGADVIALQEVDRHWNRTGLVDQPALIADALPDYYWVYGPNLDMNASYRDEKGRLVNRRKQFGNMLLSRQPFLSSRNFPLPKLGSVDHHSIQQGALEGVVETPNGPVRLYSLHLSHLAAEARRAQIEVLLDIHRRAPAEGGAWCGRHPSAEAGWIEEAEPPMPRRTVLMGDFNLPHDSPEYDLLVGPRSANLGRVNLRDGFADTWVLAGNAAADGVTCPAKPAGEPGGNRIDYCLVTADLAGHAMRAWIDTDCVASDHKPYWVDIDIG